MFLLMLLLIKKLNAYLCATVNNDGNILLKKGKMNLLDFVNSIPFNGLSYLWINGYEFHWNGCFWEKIE